ncbi:MAG: octaprenyl diphosphate synthase [Gammaproteobacteria bacterium]|nr:MAG: octaprenyl diphosphate synthase [Gammaproteobacteria bacterium]
MKQTASAALQTDPMESIRSLVGSDMVEVDRVIIEKLSSEVVLINQLGTYIIHSGGKRLRPILALLSAHACNYKGKNHIQIAAIIEFIHTATLLHDDVVDASEMRRGKETANAIWGNEASVLVGDFLYSRAFQMMVAINNMRVMDILADTTNTIAEGEVMQLMNCHNPDTTEHNYINVIQSKTAKLFEAATRLGAVVSGESRANEEALARYGMHLGTAFQLIDDVLDYSSSAKEIGKNIGDDLTEGKPTLPLIHAIQNGTPEQADTVRQAIREGGLDNIEEVCRIIESTNSIAYTHQLAQREASNAVECLNAIHESIYLDELVKLANFAVNRSF